jgi:DNA-binding response OmpR family regulator
MTTPPIIIISEPDAMISSVLRVEFSSWNFAVLLADNSEEAEAYASQTIASLVVLDATTSHLSAYKACARIRRRRGYAARPIVLTDREVSPRTKAAAETAGATILLPKPYSVLDLFRAITPHMQRDDPLLVAGHKRTGMVAPPTKEWPLPGSLEWSSGGESDYRGTNFCCRSCEGSARRYRYLARRLEPVWGGGDPRREEGLGKSSICTSAVTLR